MSMFEKKQYYISKFSLKNRYCMRKQVRMNSVYERWILTQDEYKNRYVILFENIGNFIPDLRELFFELPVHKAIIYPVDLIEKASMYVSESAIGFVYPLQILKYQIFDQAMETEKAGRIQLLRRLCNTVEELHKKHVYMMGLDKKQIMVSDGEIYIRYNGFKNYNRNSIYKIPDYIAEKYLSVPGFLDVFSLTAIIFEYMFNWNPFFGTMTSFFHDEEYQFEVFYNYFMKKMFIFEQTDKANHIGISADQRLVIEKWRSMDSQICRIFEKILTLDVSETFLQSDMLADIQKLITYYEKSELF